MKTRRILSPIIVGLTIIAITILSSFSFHNTGGTANACGSPGESGTCSRPANGCHGSGAVPAGIPDNAGPGMLTFSTVPALSSNQYIPGTTYTVSVTLSQPGKKRMGFGCEILDNSGSTDGHINNTAGTIVVTDHINTRTWQSYGTGRLSINQDTNGGRGSNPYTFNFNWIAPAKGFGTVNVYLCGNVSNNNNLADSGDYIYTQHIVLTEGTATGIAGLNEGSLKLDVYPSPSNGRLTVSFNLPEAANTSVSLYAINGQLARTFENTQMNTGEFSETYNVTDLPKGIYFMRVNTGSTSETRKVIIQ